MEKVILVTGASRGIGRAIAGHLAKKGNKVIANYNQSEQQAMKLQAELKQENIDIDVVKANVSKREEVKSMVQSVLEKYGKIDVLVNNAGIDQEKMFQDISDEDFRKVIDVNLYSVFAVTQEVLPTMIQNKNGAIINISSVYGVTGGSFATMYSASKAGINGLTKSLAKELAPSNIRVNAIAPGYINTDMNAHLSKEDRKALIEEIPLQRVGEGIDIARCVNWLVEDDYTTGQVICVDGGWE